MKKLLFDSIGHLDLLVWTLVILFFCGSALLFGGNLQYSFIGAGGVILEMLLIGIAIELIIECLKNTKGIGTITGFITNGPEALCLLVGLLVGDIIFAASTPLGSNFMNPILLFFAALVCRQIGVTAKTNPGYTVSTVLGTAIFAGSFFFIDEKYYIYWVIGATAYGLITFFKRPQEAHSEEIEEHHINPRVWLLPAVIILTVTGYFLDSVVTFAATHSHAPKGVIGFLVLATLTSWPEFKSCISLLARRKHLAAILNIAVSNITNIWLAAAGVATYLVTR
ncbi:sodium:proton exchanger [Desulfopila aestuarii]|uniref:Cation:H+ antiporter n=1 Tax=Desulfopila aestuarii DSM 18488 TaxID=1121416 RepID=A0A1M7YD83_9BACT|nr:sodium:proton exchanger [Desulfopila aestuarii]SHO50585.1 cation:H+ antiporter [Desulfopila aestuarii DSM 18488]